MLRPLVSSLPLLLGIALLPACSHLAAPAAAPAAPVVQARASEDNLNAVLWMQQSQEYRALTTQAYRAAAAQLDAALKDPQWNALVPGERVTGTAGLKPAVVVDVDETVLDNSPYQARLVRDGGEYTSATWNDWVNERKAVAVPGAVAFAREASARGVTIVYVTNRTEAQKQATLDNLRAVGLPVADDSVYLARGTELPGCDAKAEDKDCRRRFVARSYRVLMQFGDQLGDFVKVDSNTTAARDALLQQYQGWFGQRWWMLPNPSYGGWESIPYDNNRTLPLQQRLDAKRAALEVAR